MAMKPDDDAPGSSRDSRAVPGAGAAPDSRSASGSRGGERSEERIQEIQEIAARYADRLIAGEKVEAEEVLAAHPTLGPEVLEHLEVFIGLGGPGASGEDCPLGTLGDYTLRRPIGRGGMGVVYEAWEGSMNRRVALKVLPAGIAADPRALTRFVREAQVAGDLHHPNVVPVYGMGVKEKTPFFAMELIDGETLAKVLARLKDAEPEAETPFGRKDSVAYFGRLAEAFSEVAGGLHHAHSKGVIHRDVKPSNLILDCGRDRAPDRAPDQGGREHILQEGSHLLQGRLRILDFGLARLEGQESLTASGDFVGTPLYMSPEQARRRRVAVDHRTDIYSLGATLYEALTLRPPFQGKDHQDTLSQIIEREPVGPARRNPRVPGDLETIVLKCLRKDPQARYGTARALAQDLQRFASGEPIEARPEGAWERLLRRLRRHRLKLSIGLGFALLLALAAALAGRVERAEREAARERYRPAVQALAARLAAGEFSLDASAASRAQSVQFPPGPLSPLSRAELRRFLERGVLRSVHEVADELRRLTGDLPEERDGHYHLARACRLLGRKDLAAAAARRALAIDPGFVPAAAVLYEIEGPAHAGSVDQASRRLSQGASEWGRLWLGARRALGPGGGFANWPAALEAFEGLLRIAQAEGEPYAGLLLEAYLGRGAARLGLQDPSRAIEDFAVAREKAPFSLEPSLLLGKAYLLASEKEGTEKRERAQSIFESLFQDALADRREETALWIALVHVSLRDYPGALGWAGRIESTAVRERIRTFLRLELEDWGAAVASGREAVAAAPGDVKARLLLASVLLGRASRTETASCEERLELLEEVKSLSESEPENRHAAFLLRKALETVRPALGPPSPSRSSAMTRPSRCFEALAALALALGAGPLAAEDLVIRDDFVEDPDPFDGNPILWGVGQHPCCPAAVEEKPGEGIRLRSLGSGDGLFGTAQVFSGDVTFRGQVRIAGGGGADIAIHWDPFAASGYLGFVAADGSAGFTRHDTGTEYLGRIPGRVCFDPTAGDVLLEMRSAGPLVELRAWPAGDARPAEPLLSLRDETYCEGSVGFGARFGVSGQPVCIRWAEIAVASTPRHEVQCEGLEVREIREAGNNVRVTARATGDGGDPILYTFTARRQRGRGLTRTTGPQEEPVADFDLPPGEYTIEVSVADGSRCPPAAESAVCSQSYVVPGLRSGEEVIRDDFVLDPQVDDGEPLTWRAHPDGCPTARVEERPGEGIRLVRTGSLNGIVSTAEVFAGDVTVRVAGRVQAPMGAALHLGDALGFQLSGYTGAVGVRGLANLVRWDQGLKAQELRTPDGVIPIDADLIVELGSLGPRVELRVWREDATGLPSLSWRWRTRPTVRVPWGFLSAAPGPASRTSGKPGSAGPRSRSRARAYRSPISSSAAAR
ncbi:MAG: protein kinase [Planctomycetes bacterium]|nr:protein kinase [Planctomycetota bacterium]